MLRGGLWILDNNCFYQVLYIHSNADQDGDAGYDAQVGIGAWDTTVGVCSHDTDEAGTVRTSLPG